MNSASVPKSQSETPPPTYEEALYRQSVRLPQPELEPAPAGATGGSDPPPPPPPHPPPPPPPAIGELEIHTETTVQDNVTEALMEEIRPEIQTCQSYDDVVLHIDNQVKVGRSLRNELSLLTMFPFQDAPPRRRD